MVKQNVNKYRLDRASEIDLLAVILNTQGILKDISPLTRASTLCRSNIQPNNRWNYDVRNLDFGEIESTHNMRPKAVKNIILYLSIKLEGICYGYFDEEFFDPFNELAYDIVITDGLSGTDGVICCWHLDRHISSFKITDQSLRQLKIQGLPDVLIKKLEPLKEDQSSLRRVEFLDVLEQKIGVEQVSRYKYLLLKYSGDNEPENVHPRYHFQFGGNEVLNWIDACEMNFGSSLFLDTPRLSHPPLDIILGIDFVLSNFYGEKWKNLTQDSTYRKLLAEAQERFWKPYAMSLASTWTNTIASDWPSKDIWPQIMI